MTEIATSPAADCAGPYEANARRLTGPATVLVGPDDAHVLVTDAVLRAVHSARWSGVESHAASLTRTLVNLAHDRRLQLTRRESRELRAVRLGRAQAGMSDYVERLLMRSAMRSLSSGQLAVVFFHYWVYITVTQIAAQLEVSEGTVRQQLDRAKRKLREVLAPSKEEPR